MLDQCESYIQRGLQNYPDDQYLLSLEAKLATLLNDTPRLETVLNDAFNANPNSGYIAIRLSRYIKKSLGIEEANQILFKCLDHNPNNKSVHLEIAKLYIEIDCGKYKNEISSHLRKSFIDGDTNYDAQFWYARHHFINGDPGKAEKYFSQLRKASLPTFYKNKIRAVVKNSNNTSTNYQGTINRIADNYCFVTSSELNSDVFIYYNSFREEDWDIISRGTIIIFNLGFTLKGPVGINIKINKI